MKMKINMKIYMLTAILNNKMLSTSTCLICWTSFDSRHRRSYFSFSSLSHVLAFNWAFQLMSWIIFARFWSLLCRFVSTSSNACRQ
jgi:hypothetical protein